MIAADTDPTGDGVRRGWAWAAHLRRGGTTPWADWAVESPEEPGPLPGAQQLELLRRINQVGPVDERVAGRVLTARPFGRGRPDLPLTGARPTGYGVPPVDPAALPDRELLRVASSLLAEDLAAAELPTPPPPPHRRPWTPAYRLVGDPWLADPLREALVARGGGPGGRRRATVFVLGDRLDQMMADAWLTRILHEGGLSWRPWLAGWSRRDATPARVDLVRIARRWVRAEVTGRVELVLGPQLLPRGLRTGAALPARRPSADAAELLRRVGHSLAGLVPDHQRGERLRRLLLPRLVASPGDPLGVPEAHRDWVAARAGRMRADLSRDGYPVAGDLAVIEHQGHGAEPTDAGALAVAIGLLREPKTGEVG